MSTKMKLDISLTYFSQNSLTHTHIIARNLYDGQFLCANTDIPEGRQSGGPANASFYRITVTCTRQVEI